MMNSLYQLCTHFLRTSFFFRSYIMLIKVHSNSWNGFRDYFFKIEKKVNSKHEYDKTKYSRQKKRLTDKRCRRCVYFMPTMLESEWIFLVCKSKAHCRWFLRVIFIVFHTTIISSMKSYHVIFQNATNVILSVCQFPRHELFSFGSF